MEPERIALSQKERDRLKVLHEVEQGHLTQVEAGRQLSVTDRHIRRLLAQLRRQGDGALVHGLRGRPLNRQVGEALWHRFHGRKEGTLWYYRALVEVFRAEGSSPLVEELDRVVTELERLAR